MRCGSRPRRPATDDPVARLVHAERACRCIAAPSTTCSIVTPARWRRPAPMSSIRITGDCPLLDPAVIAQTVRLRAMTGRRLRVERRSADLAGRSRLRGDDGRSACRPPRTRATRPSDREHVTPFIRNNRARFPRRDVDRAAAGACRRALDARYRRRSRVPARGRGRCCRSDRAPSHLDVLAVLDRAPQLRELNRRETRNAGFAAAVAAENARHSAAGSTARSNCWRAPNG